MPKVKICDPSALGKGRVQHKASNEQPKEEAAGR